MSSEPISAAAPVVARLIEELHKLPGIGPKTAQRLAYHIIRLQPADAQGLADAVMAVKERITFCSVCQNITEENPCGYCRNPSRDVTAICVVEDPLDVLALERAHVFKGRYHVLHGVISPMNGVGPEDLKIRELLERLREGTVKELILATNPTLEGEATAMYLQRIASPLGVRVTRIARGLPVGADIEYADEVTLARAFQGRQEF